MEILNIYFIWIINVFQGMKMTGKTWNGDIYKGERVRGWEREDLTICENLFKGDKACKKIECTVETFHWTLKKMKNSQKLS